MSEAQQKTDMFLYAKDKDGNVISPSFLRENDLHFKPPTIENDLGRLSEEQIYEQQVFTNRANATYKWVLNHGIPKCYEDTLNYYKKCMRQNAPVNYRAIFALDETVGRTIWAKDTFGKLPITRKVQKNPRWQIRSYRVSSEEWPRFTKEFRMFVPNRLAKATGVTEGMGLSFGVSMSKFEIDAAGGALWDAKGILMQESAAKMGRQKSRYGFLGTSCQNAYADDGSDASGYGITGLFNYTSNQTFEAGAGGDDNVADQGDMEVTVRVALTDLKTVLHPGKIGIISTSGLASQAYIERSGVAPANLDIKFVKEILSIIRNFHGAEWAGWWVTEDIYNTTPAAANQQMLVVKFTNQISNHVIYPQQSLPMMDKMYEGDFKENMIYASALVIGQIDTTNNAVPITVAADVTADTTGFVPEGVRIF